MKIFSGSNSQQLTSKICDVLNQELKKFSSMGMVDEIIEPGRLKIDKFSDGEILPLFQISLYTLD
jgi:phosphoribosylpyrophosphate synthetase